MDRGYDSDGLRKELRRRGIQPIVPHRKGRCKLPLQDGRAHDRLAGQLPALDGALRSLADNLSWLLSYRLLHDLLTEGFEIAFRMFPKRTREGGRWITRSVES